LVAVNTPCWLPTFDLYTVIKPLVCRNAEAYRV
jgi:hypothetical protein